jgi:DNA-binding transcriptional ArsR family regulator
VKIEPKPACSAESHASRRLHIPVNEPAIERTARIFRALGEPARIRLLARLAQSEACVTELAELEGESITVISQRLRVLRADSIVGRRRDGKHILYYLADQHVLDLVFNGLAHASEQPSTSPAVFNSRLLALFKGKRPMSDQHKIYENHMHEHGKDCGHTAIVHNDHTDYLHDGHLHSLHDGHIDEHKLEVNATNPADCTNGHECDAHDSSHKHGTDCGHEAVPHGDHVDYLVNGHLHHPDGDHCDNHGPVQFAN